MWNVIKPLGWILVMFAILVAGSFVYALMFMILEHPLLSFIGAMAIAVIGPFCMAAGTDKPFPGSPNSAVNDNEEPVS
jgi:hypothetical protein